MRTFVGLHAKRAGQTVDDLAADADVPGLLKPRVPRDAHPLCCKHRERLTMARGGARLTVLAQSGHDEGVTGIGVDG